MNTRVALLMLPLAFTACAEPPRQSLDTFPRSTLTIQGQQQDNGRSKEHRFEVWVADTNARRQQGLMFVRVLPRHKGMLFLFGAPQPVSMWMKNTLIPLDMLFIAEGGRIMRIAENTQPGSLATIPSMGPAVAVLELAGGECGRLGLAPGDLIKHEAFTPQ